MTPEERAIQVWRAIDLKTHHGDEICAAIADAIRSARVDALEEAARVADSVLHCGIANAIRALKGET